MIGAFDLLISEPQAAQLTTNIVLAGVMLDSAEMLSARKAFAQDGIFTWQTNRLNYSAAVRRPLDRLFQQLPFTYLMLVQFASAVASILLPASYSAVFIVLIFLIRILLGVRNGYQGREGTDHMILMLLACILLYRLAPGDLARRAVLWFISAETILAYVTAGTIKLFNPQWRRGVAIRNILLTNLFGSVFFERALSKWPRLNVVLSWAVIGFELSAPVLVLTGPEGCLLFICCGIVFHLGVAITQGLNLFVWAFLATYPSLLITAHDVISFRAGGK